jgi:HD-like signal output (HDOD) protein
MDIGESSIEQAPHDLAHWLSRFAADRLPVLAETANELERLRSIEESVDARLLADVVGSDPLMTIKVLAHVAALRAGREGSDTETVTEALVMLGISPFFAAFGPQQVVENVLASNPAALAGFQRVLLRSRRAARFAIGFAVHRMDPDAPVIHEAALLHDFAELLLWLRAPALALSIRSLQRADVALRSADVQRDILHIRLDELEHALMQAWRLPALLVQMTDEYAVHPDPQLRNVQLAVRLARHSAVSWHDAALPDDYRDIAALLNLSVHSAESLVRHIEGDPSGLIGTKRS